MATRYSWFLTWRGIPILTGYQLPCVVVPSSAWPRCHADRPPVGSGCECRPAEPHPKSPRKRMPMKLYADLPGRRATQLATDVLVVAWVALWAHLGRVVHDAVLGLAAPARRLESAGAGFGRSMDDASRTLRGVPVVGDQLHAPFDLAAAAEHLALVLGWATALVPIILVAGAWFAWRLRFARHATAAQRLVDGDADVDLFALRAMSRQPLPRLARVSNDPVGAWRSGDRPVVRALAAIELKEAGLRPPPLSQTRR